MTEPVDTTLSSAGSAGSSTPPDRRRPRLVTMQVAVRIELPGGIAFEGHTTGLNENGVGARVNLAEGEYNYSIENQDARIILDLPEKLSFPVPVGTVLRMDGSWVPGFQYFITLQFKGITPEFVGYLRRFIRWREEEYFIATKPPRDWYLFSSYLQQQFGPLTTQEVKLALSRGEQAGVDLIWMPTDGQWAPFDQPKFEKLSAASIEADESAAEKSREADAKDEVQSQPSPTDRHVAGLALAIAGAGRKKLIAVAAMLVVLVALGVAFQRTGGFGFFNLDAVRLYKEAVKLRREANFYLATDKFKEIIKDHAGTNWADRSKVQLASCLAELRKAEDKKKAERQLQLLQKIPAEKQRHAYVLNNFGDCYFRIGDYTRAREYFLRALESDRTLDKARYNLASTYLRLGDYEVAEKTFAEVGGRMAEQPEFFFNHGLAVFARGRRNDALALMDAAIRLDPQNETLKARIEDAMAWRD